VDAISKLGFTACAGSFCRMPHSCDAIGVRRCFIIRNIG
jgi:hypothetical protein